MTCEPNFSALRHVKTWVTNSRWATQFLTRNLGSVFIVAIERERVQFLDTGTFLDTFAAAASHKIRQIALM